MAGLASFGIDEPRTQNDAPTETQTAETEELPLFVSCHDIASKGASYIYIPGRGGKHESAGGFRGGKSQHWNGFLMLWMKELDSCTTRFGGIHNVWNCHTRRSCFSVEASGYLMNRMNRSSHNNRTWVATATCYMVGRVADLPPNKSVRKKSCKGWYFKHLQTIKIRGTKLWRNHQEVQRQRNRGAGLSLTSPICWICIIYIYIFMCVYIYIRSLFFSKDLCFDIAVRETNTTETCACNFNCWK